MGFPRSQINVEFRFNARTKGSRCNGGARVVRTGPSPMGGSGSRTVRLVGRLSRPRPPRLAPPGDGLVGRDLRGPVVCLPGLGRELITERRPQPAPLCSVPWRGSLPGHRVGACRMEALRPLGTASQSAYPWGHD